MAADANSNGLPDDWETFYFGAIGQNPNADPDGDGLTNLLEYQIGSKANAFDTDGDGLPDGFEYRYRSRLRPTVWDDQNLDSDGDGRDIYREFLDGTDPTIADSAPNPGATAPLAASDLTLTTLENGHNELSWTNNDNAAGNIIERTVYGANWQTVGVVSGAKTTFTDATSLPGLVYFYRVKAFN